MTPISCLPQPIRPIIVLGFGRSGTTWISDILSKTLGGLLLFEPLHPQVCGFAPEASYADARDPELASRLEHYLCQVMNGGERHRWLLRNHLFTPLQEVSDAFVETVWRECQVMGFKEIRANFMIDWLTQRFDARIVYVARHPCAVLASIRRRANFWKELGWETHQHLFVSNVRRHPLFDAGLQATFETGWQRAESELHRQAIMWATTQALAQRQLAGLGLPMFWYEDFYEQPFAATRRLLDYLGEPRPAIHPSHLFVPSMTTLRTVHGLSATETTYAQHGVSLFWDDILSPPEVAAILDIAKAFDIHLRAA